MPSGKIPGTFGGGAGDGNQDVAVPFGYPDDPMASYGPKNPDTNAGKSVATEDRKIPADLGYGGTDPSHGTFGEGTWKGEWGGKRKGGM